MFRIDQPTAVSAMPAPPVSGTPGFFTGGNPATGQAATILDFAWTNRVQEELMSFLTAADIVPDRNANNQVLAAVEALFAQAAGSTTQPFAAAPATNTNQVVTLGQLQQIKTVAAFATNGTFTVPLTVTQIWVTAVAGGGGGGAGASTSGLSTLVGGGGGGGGGCGQYLMRARYAVTPGQVINISLGAGGIGGVVGGAAATAGGSTIIGALATLTGGGAGNAGSAASVNAIGGGGNGGTGGAGNPGGQAGSDGNYMGNGGFGASSPLGGGGAGGKSAQGTGQGGTGAAFGGGGGGGGGCYGSSPGTAGGGAAGGQGLVIIEC